MIQRSEIIYSGPHSGLEPYGDLTLGLLAALGHGSCPGFRPHPNPGLQLRWLCLSTVQHVNEEPSSVLESLSRAGGMSPARNKQTGAQPWRHLIGIFLSSIPYIALSMGALHRSERCLVCDRGR